MMIPGLSFQTYLRIARMGYKALARAGNGVLSRNYVTASSHLEGDESSVILAW